ncbi:SusC/RagA family TonB-linked outer membrane protein [Pedobacter heparinus]|uniref:SusC/RagA family TonB-linked outer membrane protein n=1 Tax=Pedobacter heparinus TaxID=984 RepID=UPI00292D1E81|nr:SusC/RagA family TonB-linked outer membrane protein [Pedobacter heparinus]
MVKISTSIIIVLLLSVFGISGASLSFAMQQQDTTKKNLQVDTIGNMLKSLTKYSQLRDTIDINRTKNIPNLSLQQMIKGNLAGVYVQETSGEPGTEQCILVRGPSGLVFNKKDFAALQPTVYLNGVPLALDNNFTYDIQQYDYSRIGPANNLLSQVNIDDIESIAIIKDPVELAKLGPNAVNGAIYINTRKAKSGLRSISVNSYFGIATSPKVYTTNGTYENQFRAPFYQKYATAENYDSYPAFLRDETNSDYFGPSNWNDLYYNTAASYNANLGISGGTERANFRFFGAGTKEAGNADHTALNKYNLSVAVNMAPFKWLTVSTIINATRLDRNRNTSLRDRFAEARYIPDLRIPISPNSTNYSAFLSESANGTDLNRSTLLNGNLTLSANLKRLKLSSSLLFDYNEGIRDYFVPSTLMSGASFVSTYFGYNQRLIVNNAASYDFDLNNKDHQLTAQIGQQFQSDTYKYNYTKGYNGPNDFIKIIQVLGNIREDDYLNAYPDFYVFRFLDQTKSNLFSLYANANYKYKDLFDFNAIVRRDGASNGQPDSRWVTSPSFSGTWHIGKSLLNNHKTINSLDLNAGWGRIVRLFSDDRFAAGPQYRSEAGFPSEPTIPGYVGIITASRPYTSGYVGYGIPLPYADRTNVTLSSTMFNNRLSLALTAYNRDDKRQVINTPVPQELGYTSEYKSGLEINNKGLELLVNADVVKTKNGFSWATGLNASYNKNKVAALPGGMKELVYQNNKLEVGKSVGSYWLYTNVGIYNTDAEVPTNPSNNQKINFGGIPLKAGDPKWIDYNNDYRIDDKDKVLTGDRLPKLTGGWNNTLSYKNFDLNLNIFFAVGQKAINSFDAGRYDFVNRESANNITAVREIYSWQAIDGVKTYPIYNPWSAAVPYRQDQDLFLENASYLKLRSATLGYNFTSMLSKSGIKKAYLYATGMNLFTLTKFTGLDPELVNYTGLYDGANITIPRTFVLGFKLDL